MDLLDSRRQSKDQEIIDNIDKNFEGDLPKRISSIFFHHFYFAFVRFVLCTYLLVTLPHLLCELRPLACCSLLRVVYLANHIFILPGFPGLRTPNAGLLALYAIQVSCTCILSKSNFFFMSCNLFVSPEYRCNTPPPSAVIDKKSSRQGSFFIN